MGYALIGVRIHTFIHARAAAAAAAAAFTLPDAALALRVRCPPALWAPRRIPIMKCPMRLIRLETSLYCYFDLSLCLSLLLSPASPSILLISLTYHGLELM
jgi:hypothetical protein